MENTDSHRPNNTMRHAKMKNEIDISKFDKADVLAALYNHSRQQGMGFLDSRGQKPMSKNEAQGLLQEKTYFDYLHGRVMKIELKNDTLFTGLYDRDNGSGAAERALEDLSLSHSIDSTTA